MSKEFWEARWQHNQTGWDLEQASPPLTTYLDQLQASDRNLNIMIPGCGSGYEALYALEHGFTAVTMVDIAPSAVAKMEHQLDMAHPDWKRKLSVICADFFELHGQFDLILEQTFFCALDPALRQAYVQQMHKLLAPKGKLVGVMFNRVFEGGPPFGGSAEEYFELFSPLFHVKTMEICYNSVAPRAGSEVFVICEKKAVFS